MPANYLKTTEKLLNRLETVQTMCQPGEPSNLVRQIEETIQRLKDNRFVLVVMGQFKRGKSTLINALIGRELLPSAIVPLTSIITEIVYAQQEEAIIHFINGSSTVIDVEDLSLYITEKENPLNQKQVAKATVKIGADLLRDGVIIVDTPGVGSTFLHNTDETYAYLPLADAAVFVLSSDPPISQTEQEFLREIINHIGTIFLVLNKTDNLDQQEIKESVSFNRGIIKGILRREEEIFPLSAKKALQAKAENNPQKLTESGFTDFENRLKAFFFQEKRQEVLNAAFRRTGFIVNQLLGQRSLALNTARLPLETLQEKQGLFANKLQEIAQQKEDNDILLKAETVKLLTLVQEDLKETQIPLIADTKRIVKEYYREFSGLSVHQEYNQLNAVAQKHLTDFYENWRMKEEEKIQSSYESLLRRYSQGIDGVIEEIGRLTAELFEVQIQADTGIKPIAPSLDFYYKFEGKIELITLTPLALLSLLPKFIVRGYFRRRNLEEIERSVDRTCGRLRADYAERVNKSIEQYKKQLTEQYEITLSAIRDIIHRVISLKATTEQEQGDFIKKCLEDIVQLQDIKNDTPRVDNGDGVHQ